MKKLEDKILDKVYTYETKNIAKKGIAFFLILILTTITGILLITQLAYQGTFDLLQIFQEDSEVIRENIRQVLIDIWHEMPQESFYPFLFLLILLGIGLVIIIRNFTVIKKKMRSLITYWHHAH